MCYLINSRIHDVEMPELFEPLTQMTHKWSPFDTKKDLNETITISRERSFDDEDILAGLRFVGPNQWPEIENFK